MTLDRGGDGEQDMEVWRTRGKVPPVKSTRLVLAVSNMDAVTPSEEAGQVTMRFCWGIGLKSQ